MNDTGYISQQEATQMQENDRTVYIQSKLGFLNAHNGLRPGSIHTVMGTPGGGKSTLMRTIVRDFAFHPENAKTKKKMLIRLSEETVSEFRAQLSYGIPEHERMMDIKISSELEDKLNGFGLEELIASHQPDVFLYDNITTSRLYQDKRPEDQGKFCSWIKQISKADGMATILVAHTGAEIHDGIARMITMNDIRGSKALVNLSEFFYIMQRFEVKDEFYPCLTICKHRGQELINKFYFLQYEKAIRSFVRDQAINFEQFKGYYAKRNRL